MLLRFVVICLLSVFINQLSFGQENTIFLKSGEVEIAQQLDIKYTPVDDDELIFLNSDNQSKVYRAGEIDSVYFEDGRKYYSKTYKFYKGNLLSEKSTFVQEILSGTISLYESGAFGDNLFIEKGDEFFQLNKPISIESNELGFGQVKFYLLQNCLPREDIVNLEFNRNAIINAINKFNRCDNLNYESKEEAVEKKQFNSFSVYLGGNFSSYNFTSSIVSLDIRGTSLAKEGIFTEGSKSQALSINIEYLTNFFRFQNIYFFLDLGLTKFDYALLSDDFSSVQNVSFNNINTTMGPAFRFDFSDRITAFTQFGASFNFISRIGEISAVRADNESVVVIPEDSYKKVQLSYSVSQSIDYSISTNTSLVLRGNIYFANGGLFKNSLEDYYSNKYGFFEPARKVPYEDSIESRYLVSIGFKYSFINTGFY